MQDSPQFIKLIDSLEQRKRELLIARKSVTRDLVSLANDEAQFGTPYLSDTAFRIFNINSAEILLEQAIFDLLKVSATERKSELNLVFNALRDLIKNLAAKEYSKSDTVREVLHLTALDIIEYIEFSCIEG